MIEKIFKFCLSLLVFLFSWGVYGILSGLFFWGIASFFKLRGEGWYILLFTFPVVIGMVLAIYHALQFSEKYDKGKKIKK